VKDASWNAKKKEWPKNERTIKQACTRVKAKLGRRKENSLHNLKGIKINM